jgi:hypothetical protein
LMEVDETNFLSIKRKGLCGASSCPEGSGRFRISELYELSHSECHPAGIFFSKHKSYCM